MGYHRAGFEVVGVDIKPQPHYPFEFHQADALTYPLEGFDAYHASPPCQAYTALKTMWNHRDDHPDLVEPVRRMLKATRKPYVIENVPGAPMQDYLTLCGSMFGLGVSDAELRRHRQFEVWPVFIMTSPCGHNWKPRTAQVYGHAGGSSKRDGLKFPGVAAWKEGMGIDWMTGDELAEAIPPAFTEHVGKYLMQAIVKWRVRCEVLRR